MVDINLSETQPNRKIVDFYWEETWSRFKNGDIQAFEMIYNQHVDLLVSYGTKITPDLDLVEDAIQDLFLYLFSKKEKLADPRSVQYYLLKAFRRILIKRIKDEGSFTSGEKNNFSFQYTLEFDDETPQQAREKKLELIESLIEQMDSKKKEVLFLKFYSGLSYEEIGRLVGIHPDSAKKQVYRTITSLREIVQKKIELFFFFLSSL
jgi:RNA polymerase sigma factor (sigma-70 family)